MGIEGAGYAGIVGGHAWVALYACVFCCYWLRKWMCLCLFTLPITNAYPFDATCVVRSGSEGVARVNQDHGGVARGGEPCLWCCNTIGR
jgi:hypothetical protein